MFSSAISFLPKILITVLLNTWEEGENILKLWKVNTGKTPTGEILGDLSFDEADRCGRRVVFLDLSTECTLSLLHETKST